MTHRDMAGRFITFEGGEGVGKSTQIRRLAASLTSQGIKVVITREPGGSPHAEQIRQVLLSGKARTLGPFAESILFNAARHDHLNVTIRPALAKGIWVLCDRFIDSTRAYQGILGLISPDLIHAMEQIVVGKTMPDLTLILDMPAEQGLTRARMRDAQADRFESEGLDFHEGLREAFLAIALAEPERCSVVDAQGDAESVAQRVLHAARERLDFSRDAGK